jgi:protein TonB
MLETSLFESQGHQKTRKPLTVVVSLGAHVLTIGVLAFVPLLQTQAITMPRVDMSLLMPRLEKPAPIDRIAVRAGAARAASTAAPMVTEPISIPAEIDRSSGASLSIDAPIFSDGPSVSHTTFIANLVSSGPSVSGPSTPAAPPLMPPPPVIDARPVRRGGDVQAANLIYQVKPAYPPLARMTRTHGIVVLEAVIARDGSINTLRVVSGHPLLTEAALDAVKQWKYRPTTLNGDPVEVITTITVTFTLQ